MKVVFADTSYFIAFLVTRDSGHAPARVFFANFNGTICTTHWVLLELANFFCASPIRSSVATFIEMLQLDPRTLLVPLTAQLFDEGFALYDQRPDKQWSLTDCVSFVVMRERGVCDALTTDHHFTQAGFISVLQSP